MLRVKNSSPSRKSAGPKPVRAADQHACLICWRKYLADTALANTCCLTASITKVVEAGAPDSAAVYQLNFFNSRIVQSKGLLYSDTVRNLTDCIRGIHGTALSLDNNSLENLNTLFASLNNADMNLYRISWTEFGVIHSHLLSIDSINNCTHAILFF